MKKIILAPGPTMSKREFLDEMVKVEYYHRSDDFMEIFKDTKEKLKQLLSLRNGDTVLLTASGTGGVEASIVNLFNPQDTVIVINNGYFGDRLLNICQTYQLNIIELHYPKNETYKLSDVQKVLADHSEVKGIVMIHHETSNGIVNDIASIGNLVKDKDIIFMVDSVSGLLFHPLQMDEMNIDCVVGGSQKGFLVPPGVAIIGLSDKALNRINGVTTPRFYFDLRKYLNDALPFTPNIPLMVALNKSCSYLLETGLVNYQNKYYNLRIYLEQELSKIGYDVTYINDENKGNVLALVNLGEELALPIIKHLVARNITITGGLGENGTHQLRIGVIGDVDYEDIDIVINELKTMKEMDR